MILMIEIKIKKITLMIINRLPWKFNAMGFLRKRIWILYTKVIQRLPQTSRSLRRTWIIMYECCSHLCFEYANFGWFFFTWFWLLRDLKSQVWYFAVLVSLLFSISGKYLPVHEISLWFSRSPSLCNVLLFFPISPRSWDFSFSCRASSFYIITS